MDTQVQQRQQCLQSITLELRSMDQPDWPAVRAKFRDIGVVEFFRLVEEAKNAAFAFAGQPAEPAAEADPPSESAGKDPSTVGEFDFNEKRAPTEPIEVIRNIFNSLLDAEQLRDNALGPVGPDGTRRTRDPAIFRQAIEIRQKLFAQALDSWEQAFHISKFKRFIAIMVQEVGKLAPDTQWTIMQRLKELWDKYQVDPGFI